MSPAGVPTLKIERELLAGGAPVVLACDEVGRGALAGPVAVGIVVIDATVKRMPAGLRDSKLLPEPKRELLAPRGWDVLNQSRGGDNTIRMAPRFAPAGAPEPNVRYLLPVNPTYVLLGLSLGNEGIRDAATRDDNDAIFDQFAKGMRGFVDRSRQNGIVPVITLCYTRMDFSDVEYEYTRRMNLL